MKQTLLVLALVAGAAGSAAGQDCKLDDSILKPLLRQAFSGLVNPQSNTTVANYAALDLKEAEVTFAGSIIFPRGSVLGIKVHGGVADGFLPIFSNSELSSKFGVDFQLSLLGGRSSGMYDLDSCHKYYADLRKLVADSVLKAIELRKGYAATLIQLEIDKLDSVAVSLRDRLNAVTRTPSGARKDSIEVALEKIAATRAAQMELYRLEVPPEDEQRTAHDRAQARKLKNWFITEAGKLQNNIALQGFHVWWISLGYSGNSTSFRLFDPALPFDAQVSDASFLSHTFRAQYSNYRYSPAAFQSYYWSVGAGFSISDNLGELKKVELTETTSFGPNPTDRVGTKKYNAFRGAYAKNLTALALFGDIYKFLFADNQGALHLYPEYRFTEGIRSAANLGVGFVLAFKNKDKPTTIVNAEIYITLSDLGNHNHSENDLLHRSSYGFRFSLPLGDPFGR